MTDRSSADTPLLLAGVGVIVAAVALLFTALHLSAGPRDLSGARVTLLLAAPCPQYLKNTEAQTDLLPS